MLLHLLGLWAGSASSPARMYALSGVMRAGASRACYTSPKLYVAINGVQVANARLTAANKALIDSVHITEVLHETPNTAAFTTQGIEPTEGQDVVITLGSTHNDSRQFAGTILNRAHRYADTPTNWSAEINAIDYTWHLTRRRVTAAWTNTSAATIAASIVAAVPGFTLSVAAGLPTLDSFSYTDVDALTALTRLAKRIGGYCDVDYRKVVKLFITDASVTNPITLTAGHATLSEFSYTKDLSQVRTRIFVEGGGVNALAPCAVGETIIPVATAAWYNPSGGTVKSGTQHLTYTGVQLGGDGSLVGPGVTPSAAPVVTLATGTGIESGTHTGAYTWVTAAGESLPSPLGTFTTATPSAPPQVQAVAQPGSDSLIDDGKTQGAIYTYVATYSYATSQTDYTQSTATSPVSANCVPVASTSNPGHTAPCTYTFTYSANPLVKWVHIWRTLGGGSTYYLVTFWSNNSGGTTNGGYDIFASDAVIVTHVSPPAAVTFNQALPSGIAVGPSGTTARKYYRSAVGSSQLKLQQTIANNTATVGVQDATADASLGANAPTSDTSGLTQPTGQVNPGSTSIIVAGTAFASATGGWAVVGSQMIRYAGFSGGALTGIPTTGNGAILAAITYNTTVTAAPALTGIPASGAGSIVYAVLQGDPVNLLVQVDDTAAQTALATLIGGTDDGIVEEYLLDGTIGETEARARGTAQLALLSTALVSIRYKTRDVNSHAGRTITVSLGSPTNLSGTFQIQQVTIDGFQYPTLYPTYTVEASSARFSLEDLLRLARAA